MDVPVTVDGQHMIVPREVAARIVELSVLQIDRWKQSGLVKPTVDVRGWAGRVSLYDFHDLLALLVAADFDARGVSVRFIRQVVKHMKSHCYERPLSKITFKIVGNQVRFQHDDGKWGVVLRPDQLVHSEVLDLEPLRQRLEENIQQEKENLIGKIEHRRSWLGAKLLLFSGTQVRVEGVAQLLASGRSTSDVLKEFPKLTANDVEAVRLGMGG